MSGYEAALFLMAICVVGNQGVDISISDSLPSTLHYHGGNCTWRVPTIVPGKNVEVIAPHLPLQNNGNNAKILCEVDGVVLLRADINVQEATPPPHNVKLDTINKRLQWDHPYIPQLPPLFVLVHGFTVTFQVYGKEDGVEMPSLSVPVSSNYFDFNESVSHCAEYEFVVQAVTNIPNALLSQNNPNVSGFFIDAPSFSNLSAVVNTTHLQQQYLHIHVVFELKDKDCPGTHPTFFIVILEGLGEHRFDINSTHIDDGRVTLSLPLTDHARNTCSLNGTLFGGNDAGNCSSACDLQHSTGSECSSAIIPTATSGAWMGTPSPAPPPQSSDGNNSPFLAIVSGVTAGVCVGVIITSLTIILFISFKKKRDSKIACKAESNEYIPTVTVHKGSDGLSGNSSHTGVFQPTILSHPTIESDHQMTNESDHQMVQETFPSTPYANDGPSTDMAHKCSQSNAKFTLSQDHVTYTEVSPIAANPPVPSCDNSTNGYATIDHKKTQETAQDEEHSAAATQQVSPPEKSSTTSQGQQGESGLSLANMDGLLATLKTLGPKWYQLGTLLKLPETMLDETQTNIETDLQCLEEILNNWLRYHDPSLENLNEALTEMNEPTLSYDMTTREFGVADETPPELPPKCSL